MKFLQRPYVLVALLIVIAFVSYQYVASLKRGYTLERRVQSLQADIEELKARREELKELKRLVESPEYVEREARLKLNLKKKGEHVIIVPEEPIETSVRAFDTTTGSSEEYRELSYLERWFYYFFQDADQRR